MHPPFFLFVLGVCIDGVVFAYVFVSCYLKSIRHKGFGMVGQFNLVLMDLHAE